LPTSPLNVDSKEILAALRAIGDVVKVLRRPDMLDRTPKAWCSPQPGISGHERDGERCRQGHVERVVKAHVLPQRPCCLCQRVGHLIAVIDKRRAGVQQCFSVGCRQVVAQDASAKHVAYFSINQVGGMAYLAAKALTYGRRLG
jgi:hypothetical protein